MSWRLVWDFKNEFDMRDFFGHDLHVINNQTWFVAKKFWYCGLTRVRVGAQRPNTGVNE